MRALPLLLMLSACADFPALDARMGEAERNAPPPDLVPLAGVLAATDALPAGAPFADPLRAEAAALSVRAGAATATPAGPDLASRVEDLAVRAEALRSEGLTEEERARLQAGGP